MENKKIAILGLIYAYADEAMGYMDDEAEPSFGKLPTQHSMEEYIAGAERVLTERPDVRRLGEVVTKIANTLPQEEFTLSTKSNPEG